MRNAFDDSVRARQTRISCQIVFFATIMSFYDRITTETAMPDGLLMIERNIEQTVFDFRFG